MCLFPYLIFYFRMLRLQTDKNHITSQNNYQTDIQTRDIPNNELGVLNNRLESLLLTDYTASYQT
jgi:hypothetical protein